VRYCHSGGVVAFKDEHAPSTLMKLLVSAGILLGTLIPAVLMFGHGDLLIQYLKLQRLEGNTYRQLLMVSCSLIYLFRFATCMFVFMKRKIGWFEGGLVSFLFFMMFYLFNTSAGSHSESIGLIDIAGVFLYLTGSYINTLADYQRYAWKRNSENKGRLYTKRLFKYSMHINYFGDSVLYIGLAMITLEYVCLFVSVGIILNFVFLQIPMLDKHLSKKYTDEFGEYVRQTKKFIPFVY
jgi:steroid 5-alpha reductase family enzyme